MMAAKGTEVGQGAVMIQSFLLDKGSTITEVKMTSSSTRLTWKANLHSLTPVGIPPQQASITFDWTDSISKNALGATFEPTYITSALVGHYSESVAQLEGKFLDIELIATELYEGSSRSERASTSRRSRTRTTTLLRASTIPAPGLSPSGAVPPSAAIPRPGI